MEDMWEGPPRRMKFTPDRLVAYKAAYHKAVDECLEVFMFEDHEWLTSFAKYMVEFLETIPELKEDE